MSDVHCSLHISHLSILIGPCPHPQSVLPLISPILQAHHSSLCLPLPPLSGHRALGPVLERLRHLHDWPTLSGIALFPVSMGRW